MTERVVAPAHRGGAGHPGPPPAAPAIGFAVLLLVGVLLGPLTGSGSEPSPYGSTTEVAGWFTAHATVAGIGAWLLVLSAVPLAVFTAVVWSRLVFLAPNVPGPTIAGVGGVLASATLATSGLLTWAASRPALADDPTVIHALHYASFAAGGAAHVAALGVSVAGIAVTTLFVARTPRWLSVVGIVLAVVDVLASVVLVAEPLAPLLPIGRFASMAWLIAIASLLPRERAARGRGV